ncbi:MAG: LppC family lipoprotein [Alteromonadaceae bacterium]|nr:LppC family lipoprotein [Alteromonadaceae bacterium]MBH84702.1 LppC family lipoprotein [Alteromonadaceae bacterium]
MTTRALLRLRPAFLFAAMLMIAACAPFGIQPDQADSPEGALAIAESSGYSETALKGLLSTASRYQTADRHKDARTILRSTAFAKASDAIIDQQRLLAMSSIVELEDRDWARKLTTNLPVEQFSRYPQDRQDSAAQLQARTFKLAGRTLAAAQTLMASADLQRDGNSVDYNDRIWQLLKETQTSLLEKKAQTAIGYEQQGWLELALSLRKPDVSLDSQGGTIRGWQSNWADHPAAVNLPSELSLIISLSEERPGSIALALPLTGPLAEAGKAIRDGFMAAYYTDQKRADADVRIDVFNTDKQDFPALYTEIAKAGPDLIVGPLEKTALNSVAQRATLPVPLLALNYLDDGQKAPANLYQYGLSAEDEARQIADRLVADNLSQAVALIPYGDWGDRIEQALVKRMTADNGRILDVVRYDREENLRKTVASLFDIDVSRQRAITVEQTIGLNIEFEPRRRQDIDAIVLVASPTIARQLKPMFAFYFGGNLPVYSPSIIYTGTPDSGRDGDLENIHFTDLPWMLSPDEPLRKQASAALPDVTQRYGRLFAMGVDAYQLSSKLQLLSRVEGSDINGLTGTLSMTPSGVVSRQQQWAMFKNGVPVKLESKTPDNTEPTPPTATPLR